jgi:hypothetical protein
MNLQLKTLAFLSIAWLQSFCSYGQHYTLGHQYKKYGCSPYVLNYGVENPVLIRSSGNKKNLKHVKLVSDSISITRINDSSYTFRPLYDSTTSKIYFYDSRNNKKLDSVTVRTEGDPFFFSITEYDNRHGFPFIRMYRTIKRLYVRSHKSECHDFAKDVEVKSYTLSLERDGKDIHSISLKGNPTIPQAYLDTLYKIGRVVTHGYPTDILVAKDIILVDKKKAVLIVKRYLLLPLSYE